MDFLINNYPRFASLPFQYLEKMPYAIYVLDLNWNYLFVNEFVYKNLNHTNESFLGSNMWERFPLLAIDPDFQLMRKQIETLKSSNIITTSPLTGQRISIAGYKLEDCYYFSSSIMLNKEDLLTDLRKHLDRG